MRRAWVPRPRQGAGGEIGAGQYAEDDRKRQARIDVPQPQIDAGTGGRGHADHEVTGGRGHLERHPHRLVHRQNFHSAGADAEQPRQDAGGPHQGETERDAADVVVGRTGGGRIAGIEPQPRGDAVRSAIRRRFVLPARRQKRGGQQNDAENDSENRRSHMDGQGGADQRPAGGRHFQKHADADVRVAFLDIRRRRAGGGGNDGDQGRADGVAHIDAEHQDQERHQHHTAPQPRHSAQETGEQ